MKARDEPATRGVRTPTFVPLTGRTASDLLLARDHHCEHAQERADHDHTGKAGDVTTPAGVASAAYTGASSASVIRKYARRGSARLRSWHRNGCQSATAAALLAGDEAGDASVLEHRGAEPVVDDGLVTRPRPNVARKRPPVRSQDAIVVGGDVASGPCRPRRSTHSETYRRRPLAFSCTPRRRPVRVLPLRSG
jgi:hypothetical protein